MCDLVQQQVVAKVDLPGPIWPIRQLANQLFIQHDLRKTSELNLHRSCHARFAEVNRDCLCPFANRPGTIKRRYRMIYRQ